MTECEVIFLGLMVRSERVALASRTMAQGEAVPLAILRDASDGLARAMIAPQDEVDH